MISRLYILVLFVVFLTYLAYDMLVPILSIYFKEIGLTITLIGILMEDLKFLSQVMYLQQLALLFMQYQIH